MEMIRPDCKISTSETVWLDMLLLVEMVVLVHYYYYYFMHKIDLFAVLFATLAASALMVIYTCFRIYRKGHIQTHVLATIFVIFMGPLGCLIAMIASTFHLIFARSFQGNFSDWLYQHLFVLESQEKASDKIYQRIVAGQEEVSRNIDTEPLVDIMNFGTIEQKQAALIKVVKYFRPHLTPVLQMGLHDSNNSIRVQAAAGLAKLQDDFHKKYMRYERKVTEGSATDEELVHFARICEEYSSSALLDSERKSSAIKESIRLYEKAIERVPDRIELKSSLIRVLLIDREMERANAHMTMLLEKIGKPSPQVGETVLELLFALGRYVEMQKYAKEWRDEGRVINDSHALWSDDLTGVKMEWGKP